VSNKKIKISKELMDRIKEAVELAGYSSVDELVETALERELERISGSKSPDSEEAVRKQLQGLGYIE
jgi:Arc/MetJ-type ribon-helix-helix transcriptional regulator